MTIDTNGIISALSEFAAITKQVVPDDCKENLLNTIALLSSAIETSINNPKISEIQVQESSMVLSASVDLTVKSSKSTSSKVPSNLSLWISLASFIISFLQFYMSTKPDPQIDTLIHQQQVIIDRLETRYNQESAFEEILSEDFVEFKEDFTESQESFIEFAKDFRERSERIINSLNLVGDIRNDIDNTIDVVDNVANNETNSAGIDKKSDDQNKDTDCQ